MKRGKLEVLKLVGKSGVQDNVGEKLRVSCSENMLYSTAGSDQKYNPWKVCKDQRSKDYVRFVGKSPG
jgi:hypothetical protein